MISPKEFVVLRLLRNNSRIQLTEMSKLTGLSRSTLFYILKRVKEKYIRKCISLLDTSHIMYNVKVMLAITAADIEGLQKHLSDSLNVNSISESQSHLLAECFFKNQAEAEYFIESLDEFRIIELKRYDLIDELKKEAILC